MGLKTASKPIASMLKSQAGRHRRFRQFIIDIGQGYHRFTTTDVEIRPLNEEKATQAGSRLIGQFVVSSVTAVVLIGMMQRRAKSKAAKNEMIEQNFKEMSEKKERVLQKMNELQQKMNEIEQLARGQGLSGIFELDPANSRTHESSKSTS